MAFQSLASNANRLSQRLQENFRESTRDLTILQGNPSSSAGYLDGEDKTKDVAKLLESRIEGDRLDGMKRIIAMISKGRDMEMYFAQVVKNVATPSIEIRKLVYIYLLRYASSNPDLLLLSINTFQKDLSDHSPLIRSMSLRVLTSIRLPVIQGIVMIGLNKLVKDRNPWVRKSVAGGLAKVYDMDTTTQPLLLPILETLLASPSPITLGATLTAWSDICPDNLAMLHPHYRRLCRLLVDADEWGQTVALGVLLRYARAMLERPETAGACDPRTVQAKARPEAAAEQPNDADGADSADEVEDDLDQDLYLLLFCAKPLLQSHNPSVVLGTVQLFYHLAPAEHDEVPQAVLVQPLLRLVDGLVRSEIASLAVEVCQEVAKERPWLFEGLHTRFLLRSADSIRVKRAKIAILQKLVSPKTAPFLIKEFTQYARSPQVSVSTEAINAIGFCARTQPEVYTLGLGILMKMLRSNRDNSVAQAVIVLKSLIQSSASQPAVDSSRPSTGKLVAKLVRQLEGVSNSSARACVFWLAGQYAAAPLDEASGRRFAELAPWAADTLRIGVKGFMGESTPAKLQILTLAAKLLVLCSEREIQLLSQYLFSLARYDLDWDVRDRGRFLNGLLRGIRTKQSNGNADDTDEDEDIGGVTLRREQVKMVLLGDRPKADIEKSQESTPDAELPLGSLSSHPGRRLQGAEPLCPWAEEPTDPSLRDVEEEMPANAPPLLQRNSSYLVPQVAGSPITAIASSPMSSSPAAGHTARLSKPKVKDLESFLDESSEEESSEEEAAPMAMAPVARTAPTTFGPVYQEDEASESEEETSEDDDDDENDELMERSRQ